jgi:hypothetical protein
MPTLSTTTRNRYRDAWIAAFPAGSTLTLHTGAGATGTTLATITLPATPWTAGTGQVTRNGTWSAAAAAAGTAVSYRLANGADTETGTVTATGGGGDLTLDNTSIAAGQLVAIETFTRIMPDA